MSKNTLLKRQKKEDFRKRLPERREVFKGIDFNRYRVAQPSELINEPIRDGKRATSTSLDEKENSTGFGWITER